MAIFGFDGRGLRGSKLGLTIVALVFSVLCLDAASAQITLNPASLPNGTQGAAYNQTVTASGGTGPYTYAVTSGALPSGLSLNTNSGAITGTPTVTGVNNFTITATDSLSATGNRAYSIAVGTFSLTLLPTTLPPATQGVSYNQTITAVGGTAPYTFSVSSGSLPTGLSLSSGGVLSGTPSVNGSFGFIIQATDANGNTGFRTYTLNTGVGSSLTINPATLPSGSVGTGYNQTISASGGTGPYTFSISSGSLPPGLSLNANSGVLNGTPTTGGAFNFTVHADDSVGNTGNRAYTVNIGSASLTINPSTLPNGTVSVGYSQTVTASGGTGPYTYSISSGSLPTGLSLNVNSGAITGTPTTGGSYNFTVHADDSLNNFGNRNYTVNIGIASLTVNPSTLPNGTVSTPYNQTVTASGGTGPYTFSVVSGSLPAGLSLNANTGAITGTPSAAGTSNFTVQALDTLANSGTRAYTVNINLTPLTINPPTMPAGSVGTAYSQTVIASGGTGPYSYLVLSGSLPTGLSLNPSTGAITGTPSAGGSYTFTVQATDSTPNTGTRQYTVNIGTNSLTVSPPALPSGSVGLSYSQTVIASGGTGPYTYSLSSGSLPPGLSLNASTGAITGTPTGSGPSTFAVRAVDVNGNFGSRNYTVNIGTNSLTVNPATLPPAPQGAPYSQTVTAIGGIAPYTFTLTSGSLPPGLSLNASTGAITGTPTASGTYAFTIQARDPNGNIGSRAYSLTTERPSPALDPTVRALVASQAATVRRFSGTQVMNVGRHLETLHGDFDPCGFNIGIGISTMDPRPLSVYAADPASMMARPGAAGAAQRPADPRQPCGSGPQWWPTFAFWASGAAQFGSADATGQINSNRFTTSGLTAGVDVRVHERLIVGGAAGYGADRTTIGTDGTFSDGSSFSAMFYASAQPLKDWFIDGLVGYGSVGFDNRRFAALDSTLLSGTRSGANWFGSVSLSTELKFGAFKVSPYVRAELMSATLKGYAEQGGNMALTYSDTSFGSAAGVLGIRGSIDVSTGWGVVTPMVRVEYTRAWDGGSTQSMFYNQVPDTTYALILNSEARNLFGGALGVRARAGRAALIEIEYGAMGNGTVSPIQSVRASARFAF